MPGTGPGMTELCLCGPPYVLLKPPVLDLEHAVWRLQRVRLPPHVAPSALLIEPRRAIVADSAGEPRRRRAAAEKLGLGSSDQPRGKSRAARLARHEELIKLVASENEEPGRRLAEHKGIGK